MYVRNELNDISHCRVATKRQQRLVTVQGVHGGKISISNANNDNTHWLLRSRDDCGLFNNKKNNGSRGKAINKYIKYGSNPHLSGFDIVNRSISYDQQDSVRLLFLTIIIQQ